jgi:1,4-alpha-glucan branching enzyme
MLYSSTQNKIVYQKTHDDCGNAGGTARTIVTAVNYAPLIGATRDTAEARCRLVFGLSLLSAGTPMFFMAEEIGAQKTYKYDNVLQSREDILGDSKGLGARMFCFYQDLITLSKRLRSIRSQNIDIIHQSDANRIIVFKRWIGTEEVIIFASINNSPFKNGYVVEKDLAAIPNSSWKEIFNSDSSLYGGQNVGNAGASIPAHDGKIAVNIPSNGFVVFVKQ